MHTNEKENTHRHSTPISTRLPACAKGIREEDTGVSSALSEQAVGEKKRLQPMPCQVQRTDINACGWPSRHNSVLRPKW